jgi:hypothetical protein
MRIRRWPTTSKVRRIHRNTERAYYSRALVSEEGENEENWLVQEMHSEDEADAPSSNFAPRGASKFQERVRNKLPKPLDLTNTRHGKVVEKLYSACSVSVSVSP